MNPRQHEDEAGVRVLANQRGTCVAPLVSLLPGCAAPGMARPELESFLQGFAAPGTGRPENVAGARGAPGSLT